ncbi:MULTISPECIES: carbohydrate ABC transporter permease [unclassified Paenibacillus]|uniref:carbohydrate ABC transporter permease n=1 Tax=unclassified Paenibacillus TaxID=185978 RepID=UPI001C11B72A|nr:MULTISPECIES: sugar ABC transporter permease [unclassified Paenibacillus]MBU5445614.1 sugar ABC transporter permease [Paenibacillus sp. MSJ-34]CAH0121231.1 Melibiose/raffinose/stachyose import permease protein MelD [Paenibacillus sp. CECT 9249]
MKIISRSWRREFSYILFVVPALVIYCIFFATPTINTFWYSFTNWSDVNPVHVKFVGWDNYKVIFQDSLYLTGIKNTLIYAVMTTLIVSVLAVPLAVVLNKKLITRNVLRSVFFLPAVFSVLVIGFLWNYMYSTSDFGLINKALEWVGLKRVNFLGDPKLALYSVIFTQIWQWVGYNMVIILANMQSIPQDYYEAATIDGANGFQSFRFITLPLLLPSITFITVTGMINGMKVFDIIYSLTSGGPGYATETIISLMIKKGITEGFYSYGAAFGMVFVCIVGIITFIQMKLISRWDHQ